MSSPKASDYYCNACGKTVQRASDKRWIKSYCDTAGRTSRLWRRALPPGGGRTA